MALPLVYNWRNLFVRKLSTLLTFVVVVIIVLVLSVLLSFAAGIRASLAASGSPSNIIILKPGATAESTSIIGPEDAAKVMQVHGIACDKTGRPLISHELCVQTSVPRRGPVGNLANVAIRGVEDASFGVHDQVRLMEGRRFATGSLEVIVGKAARDRYINLNLGGTIAIGRLGNRQCRVVGVFEAGGSALESEIWAPLTLVTDSYNRRFFSRVIMRLINTSEVTQAIAYINGPAVNLEAKQETAYYDELSTKTSEIVLLTSILVGIMAIGAVFAVANTMYAAVDGRKREIAMLRTIGFSRRSIMLSFVIESVMICTMACLCGLALSFLVHGSRQDFLSDATWTVLVYELRITRSTLATSLVISIMVGVAGAMAPAIRAARIPVIEALRKA